MQIESLKISDITHDINNARQHSTKNLSAIKNSLKKFGQQKPIVIDRNNVVIAGNGTLLAAAELGWEKINAVRTDLNGLRAVAYALADNRSGELAEWNFELLSDSLETLKIEQFPIDELGFDDTFIRVKPEAGKVIDDHRNEDQWQGMPEYSNNDETSFRRLIVHFADNEAVQDFCRRINQSITDRTRAIWHPMVEREKAIDKYYES